MKLNKVEMGIHTIELYTGALKYSETQKVIDYVTDKGAIQIRSSDPYNLDRRMKSSYFIDRGITMRIHQSHNKSNGISFAVNPTSLLSRKYQPLKLYKPTKGNVMDMLEQLETLFKEIQLSHCDKPVINPENLSLSRMDLTLDLYCSKDTNLSSLIRIFRKSKCPRHYKRHELKGEKAHYFSFKNKKCCFKVYDKVYELKKFDRCPPEIKNQKILRLEVSVKREKFLKYFNLKRDHNLYIMLNAGYKEIRNVLVYYLDKLFPSSGTHLPYLSHRAGTCGLHVHISRAAFGKTEQEQDAPIARVLYFFEKHWEELLKFSRRTQRQLERWAARYGYREQPRDILDHAKKGCHAGRYTCVNLTNRDTVEFRMFRGTLKVNTITATLQLLDRICDVAISLSDDEVRALSWTTFVSGCTQPELLQYLKERRLYVNEPVGQEEEI